MAGEMDKLKGKAKQVVGDLTDNNEMVAEGKRDEAAGKMKDAGDKLKDKAEDAIDRARD